jgi:hypothetical protein
LDSLQSSFPLRTRWADHRPNVIEVSVHRSLVPTEPAGRERVCAPRSGSGVNESRRLGDLLSLLDEVFPAGVTAGDVHADGSSKVVREGIGEERVEL